jgi:hypothetical protein
MWTVLNGSVGTREDADWSVGTREDADWSVGTREDADWSVETREDADCIELVEDGIQRRVYCMTVFGSVKMDRFFWKNLVIFLYSVVS